MTSTITPTINNIIANAANGIRVSSHMTSGSKPSPYTLGFALAMSHMDYTVTPTVGGCLLHESGSTLGKRTHVYLVRDNGTVLDISGITSKVVTGKRLLAITFYVDCVMATQRTLVRVNDMSLVRRAFKQVVNNKHRHL